jgi:hypothetical protein
LAFLSEGCLSDRFDLYKQGLINVERQGTRYVYISSVFIYQEEDSVVIRGSVRRRYFSPGGIYRGHVDIVIADADGTKIYKNATVTFPRDVPGRGTRRSSFSTTIENMNLTHKNAIVCLRYHYGSPDKCVREKV